VRTCLPAAVSLFDTMSMDCVSAHPATSATATTAVTMWLRVRRRPSGVCASAIGFAIGASSGGGVARCAMGGATVRTFSPRVVDSLFRV